MKFATTGKILATGLALLILVFEVAANDPIFVKWLVMDDPGDETIHLYWQRAEAGELNPKELVDLGTMLFYRGWPNDAIGYFREAAEAGSRARRMRGFESVWSNTTAVICPGLVRRTRSV